ncbi:MAG: FAD-dependent oxidoreductase [Flavobacteriales bacterium]|nr:FAD-dependent oxidoreductase [Flavobacteriales bacterium]
MERIENLILGAGPAGIAAAIRLGKSAKIIDKNNFIGGQSASLEIGEAVFDIGGHSFHTPHPFVKDLVYNSLDMYEQVRKAYCYSYDTLIPYPFQKNFRQINNEEVVAECAKGLETVDPGRHSDNFREFIANRFGEGISKHFMNPYNEKLWARDLTKLDAKWVGERVAAPEGIKEKFDLEGGKRKPLQADTVVGYPAKGGFGEIYKALAKKVHDLELGVFVTGIDLKKKEVYTKSGKTYAYDNLISTIPINELIKITVSVPENIRKMVNKLEYMSLKCVMVAINHPVDTEVQRIYSGDNDNPAHKTAINHNSSDWLRSRKHHGIMGEVSYSDYKYMHRKDLEQWFLDCLKKMGIIKGFDEVMETRVVDIKYAYPVPTHDRVEIMTTARNFLVENNIHSLGRFGEWAYINSDEALARGMILGEQILGK